MSDYKKIVFDLPNGDQLVAEECPYNGAQIAIGIVYNGTWIQDLAVIESENNDGEYVEDKFNVYVYGSEYDECYTECFNIARVPSDAL